MFKMHNFSFNTLSLVSYLAPNWFYFYEAVAQYWGRSLGIPIHLVQSTFDPLEDLALRDDQVDIAFICGLPFVRLQEQQSTLDLIAAPILQGTRYGGKPVYFADAIVRAESEIEDFLDLAGRTFCYNDAGSNSGYCLVYRHIEQLGLPLPFFGKAIASGSHQASIRWVIEGLADCAAIDSTVLEQELRNFPELVPHLRVIKSIGPSPMPPIVASRRLGTSAIQRLQDLLLHPDAELQAVMNDAQVKGYQPVAWSDYTNSIKCHHSPLLTLNSSL
jgi:phosphonate transport system substrate-binding protein